MTVSFVRISNLSLILLFACTVNIGHAQASKNLAPGFTTRAAASKLVILPVDMELFSISAGGVSEPKADWTQAAVGHFSTGMSKRKELLGANITELPEKDFDELAEINALHGAVAQSVFLHHMLNNQQLLTKAGALNWSMGDSIKPLKDKTGADYALFVWIRDTYASPERKAAMVVMAVLGVGLSGGSQIGYASLVDLNDGRIVWFNDIRRSSGDLREFEPAQETIAAMLKGFPVPK